MKKALSLFLGGIILLIFTGFVSLNSYQRWDRTIWDSYNRWESTSVMADTNIVMVAVDQGSLDLFAEYGVLWPWPRDLWAHLVTIAETAGARLVLFDVMFDEAGIDRLNTDGYSTDMAFASKLENSSIPVFISCRLSPASGFDERIPDGLKWQGAALPGPELSGYYPDLPHPRFRNAQIGIPNVKADMDGIIRFVPFSLHSEETTYPALAIRAAMALNILEPPYNDITDKNGNVWLKFYGEGGPADTLSSGNVRGGAFNYISAASLILGQVSHETLKGKILIVGGYAAGLLDYVTTPVTNPVRPFPGFELHATYLSNLLQGDTLHMLPLTTVIPIILLAGIGFLLWMWTAKRVWIQVLAPLCFTLFVVLFGWITFKNGALFPVASAMVPIYLALATQTYVGWAMEGKNRKRLFTLFSRYLDGSVIQQMVDKRDELQMEGEEKEVVVLFADYQGFTSVSEVLSPPEVVSMLNEYFSVVVSIILEKGGMLDKYIGDAVMVLFGAPFSYEDAQQRAAEALLGAQRAVEALTEQRTVQKLPTLNIRIGVHYDKVVLGNMGHPKRMDYTAIGPGVNLASRVESSTRTFGAKNLATETFCEALDGTIHKRKVVRAILKGLHEPKTLYELIDENDAGPWLDEWNVAWHDWKNDERQRAIKAFKHIASERSDDITVQKLIERLEPFVDSHEENDDVVIMHSK